jgi:hypothetical protein
VTTGKLVRQGAVFAGIFLLANLALDAWRTGDVTRGVFSSAVVATLVATPAYVLFLWLIRRRRDGR